MAQAKDTKDTQDTQAVGQSGMTEGVLVTSRCDDGLLSVLEGLTYCRQTAVQSLPTITFS